MGALPRFSSRPQPASRWELIVGLMALVACSPPSDDPPQRVEGSEGIEFDFDIADEPPPLGAVGYCGNQLIRTQNSRRNLYFVVDRSSSMASELEGSEYNRFDSVRSALADVLVDVGYRVHYGAAVFPGSQGGCAPGEEVFPTQVGDSISFAATHTIGPVLGSFLSALEGGLGSSGTPLSPTLRAVTPTLTELEGETFVVLATDGHPNCNPEAVCGTDSCYYNMLSWEIAGRTCDSTWNCCAAEDPILAEAGVDGPIQCVDRDPTVEAIGDLAANGIRTYVIGLPDSFAFEPLLNEMAVVGGTAQEGKVKYIPVTDAVTLDHELRRIGAEVAVSCDLELDAEPPDAGLVNVYLDAVALLQDEVEGWTFLDGQTIRIQGAACDAVLAGDVLNVQIVAGCPTEVR